MLVRMIIGKSYRHIFIIGLGFIAALAVGMLMFVHLRRVTENYSNLSQEIHRGHIENLNIAFLATMAQYIEDQYPVLHDTDYLKQAAGTDWFWDFADELYNISKIFDFAYIYYIEKNNDNYIFLLSSGIRRDEHPEWLGGPVWEGRPPAFIDEAWETKQLTLSNGQTVNEWGSLISAELPIITDGKVVGILGIDYDISFMNKYVREELQLQEQGNILQTRIRNVLIISIIVILGFMLYEVWFGSRSVVIPVREHEAEERTRIMLDATPMICALWGNNGKLLDCNNETLKILGLSKKADFLEHFFDLCPEYQPNGEFSREVIKHLAAEAIATGSSRYEWNAFNSNGDPIPLDLNVVRVPWKNRWRFACYAQDLREIKAKEALVLETEERLRIMLDTMAFACLIFDPEGNPVDCNQRAIDLFCCNSKKEFLDNFISFSPSYQPDKKQSARKVGEIIQEVFKTGTMKLNWEHVTANGSRLPVEVTLVRVVWKDGYRCVAYLRDLSKLLETENRLKRVQVLAETSPNLTFFLGSGGNIEYITPSASTISGFSQEELLEDGLSLIFSREDFQLLHREYIAAALRKEMVSFEMTVTPKSGMNRDFSFSAFAVELNDGSKGIGISGKDITELKQMQRELAAAKEKAEKALASEVSYNKAKSDFMSRVSHELRTPLNTIIGITSIAASKEKEPNNGYGKIKDASEHLLWLVNDILDVASFDTGKFDFSKRPFSFSTAINAVIENIAEKVKAKEQVFLTKIDSGIHDRLISDEQRLKQMLLNLLYNAVKFTPKNGKIEFNVKSIKQDENGCFIRFEIVDSGIGIAPKDLEHLGEVLEQVDSSITRQYGGLGLGLSLTKRILEMMDGRIFVESESGKGSRFICEIRLDEEPGGEIAAAAFNSSALLDLSGKRVLVVDDVDINREILVAILEDTGAMFDEAGDGDEAVKMFSRNKYDLILMDLHMPLVDGFTATKKIRALDFPWAKTIPIIAVSAETGLELSSMCVDAGITDYFSKPVEMKALYQVIARWMNMIGGNGK